LDNLCHPKEYPVKPDALANIIAKREKLKIPHKKILQISKKFQKMTNIDF